MGQHHAFRVGGCTGGVEQGSEITITRRRGFELAGSAVEDRGKIAQPVILDGMTCHAVWIHQDHAQFQFSGCGTSYRNMLRIAENRCCAAIFQKLGNLIVMQGGIEGNGGAA